MQNDVPPPPPPPPPQKKTRIFKKLGKGRKLAVEFVSVKIYSKRFFIGNFEKKIQSWGENVTRQQDARLPPGYFPPGLKFTSFIPFEIRTINLFTLTGPFKTYRNKL